MHSERSKHAERCVTARWRLRTRLEKHFYGRGQQVDGAKKKKKNMPSLARCGVYGDVKVLRRWPQAMATTLERAEAWRREKHARPEKESA